MTASFGTLQNDTLELGDGLNIVFAPNESGKSTWCGFIKAMLYGIDTSARERGGVKPEKVRFAPWSGKPMAGTMEIEYEGASVTLTRQGRESAPMRECSVVYTGTGDPVRGVDLSSPGETLLGVSKDVFERSAFIGQGKLAGGSSPELERRIAAIVQTGEEGSSVTEAQDRIRAAMRRRRFNKNGRLPEIESEIAEAKAQLAAWEKEAGRGEELKKAKREALARRDELVDKLAEEQAKARRDTLDRLAEIRRAVKTQEEAVEAAEDALEEAGKRLDASPFGRQDPVKCRQKLNADKKSLQALDKEESHGGNITANLCVLIAFAIVAIVTAVMRYYIPAAICAALAVIQGGRLHLIHRNYERIEKEKNAIFEQYRCLTVEGMERALSSFEALYRDYGALLVRRSEEEDSLSTLTKARAEIEASLLREIDTTGGSPQAAAYRQLLDAAEATLRSVSEEIAAWEGRQSALRDPVDLKAQIDELTAEREKLTFEYEALKLALDTLSQSGDNISQRITPRLSARTAEIFSMLTANRYDSVLLDKELRAAARQVGDPVTRDASFLSTGAVDQLYLAVRLAVCELALPEDEPCPIILDDALVNFDDERCRCALEVLHEMAQTRQIILFTCHGRELSFMRGTPDVRIMSVGRPG